MLHAQSSPVEDLPLATKAAVLTQHGAINGRPRVVTRPSNDGTHTRFPATALGDEDKRVGSPRGKSENEN